MKTCRTLCFILIAVFAVALPLQSASAAYPEKPIQFIIPFGAGGGADIEGRLLAKGMAKELGVPVVAINKPGAGGAVTYTFVKNSKPDGYIGGLELHLRPHFHEHRQRAVGLHGARSHRASPLPAPGGGGERQI